MIQQSMGRSFRDRNKLKPKVVFTSLSDYNNWRKKLVDTTKLNKQLEWISIHKEFHDS